jgi:hypothetical protein
VRGVEEEVEVEMEELLLLPDWRGGGLAMLKEKGMVLRLLDVCVRTARVQRAV